MGFVRSELWSHARCCTMEGSMEGFASLQPAWFSRILKDPSRAAGLETSF